MSSEREARDLHAFVDDELELSRRLDVEQRIDADPAFRRRVDDLRQLRATLRGNAEYHAAPDDLRQSVVDASGLTDARHTTAPHRAAWWRWPSSARGPAGWRPWAPVFAAIAISSVGLQLVLVRSGGDARTRDDVVASHVRSTIGDRLVDIASSDHHTVKPWLSSKLDYSPPVRDTRIGDANFVGARVDYLDGRPVAALVYRKGQHVVDAYVWPTASGDREPVYSTDRGFQIAHWSSDGMTYWAISDVNRTEFADLIALLAARNP